MFEVTDAKWFWLLAQARLPLVYRRRSILASRTISTPEQWMFEYRQQCIDPGVISAIHDSVHGESEIVLYDDRMLSDALFEIEMVFSNVGQVRPGIVRSMIVRLSFEQGTKTAEMALDILELE